MTKENLGLWQCYCDVNSTIRSIELLTKVIKNSGVEKKDLTDKLLDTHTNLYEILGILGKELSL